MSEQTNTEYEKYYVPAESKLPFIGSVGLLLTAFGAGHMVQGGSLGWVLYLGIATLIYMLSTWWRSTIKESMDGLYSAQMSRSFRQGMMWFITSEVMFFFAFFGALFYVRALVMPWLGGEGNNLSTHNYLYEGFVPTWPLTETPAEFPRKSGLHPTWELVGLGLPAINTAILLFSSFTLTVAHHALIEKNRSTLILFTAITAALGVLFLGLQMYEYVHAYNDLNLKLSSGIYGSTFYMLTGFHGMHVLIGTIFLIILTLRTAKGHFTPKDHFAYEAGAWYWHFVDVVWVFLFIFVYLL
ncbi:MAG: cytochrome c oxidase subunit 3 [Kangiellaceae bacterium]|nr:cytochrome c oxidase subunit 3 [Kangiellaceae bacterium]